MTEISDKYFKSIEIFKIFKGFFNVICKNQALNQIAINELLKINYKESLSNSENKDCTAIDIKPYQTIVLSRGKWYNVYKKI